MRSLSTEILPSTCPLDCPDTCSLEVTVTHGKVEKIEGTHRNPLTDGFICSKVRRFPRHLYGDERLLQPARRRGEKGRGDFEKLTWDGALDLLAERLGEVRARHGGEAILPLSYGGSNGYLTQDTTDARLFRRLGASRLARTVCAAATGRAVSGLYGKMPGVALEDYVHSRLIVVWGANPSATGIHLVPIIRQAQRGGARLVVVDPRRTPLAKKADLHLAPRPGTDLPVALALIRWLFDSGGADREFLTAHATGARELEQRAEPWTLERAAETSGIEAADIETLARLYADSEPAVIRCGWGQERNRNGGSATAAILALPAVAGKFGVRGGGFTLSSSGAWKLDSAALAGEEEPATRLVNMNKVGELLLSGEPAVRLLFVYNANPLATLPEQEKVRAGLEREDLFTVVFDQVMTDTARYADLVLPATTFLEHHELRRGYGTMALQEGAPVIEPVGEARPNYAIFGDLCRRLGLDRPGEPGSPTELTRALLAQSERGDEMRAELDAPGITYPDTGRTPVQFVDHFPPTADGKIHLLPPELDREAPRGLYAYQEDPGTDATPLALISPATNRTVSSTFGQLHRKQVPVEMHPADAGARGLQTGDAVRVWSRSGEVRCQVRLSHDLRRGVAMLPKGIWSHNTLNGATANALAPDTLTDLAGGACFNDARVEVEKL
ncbi:MAG: molybdopterin-dependent oxidoreductase [bacterium]|nr:molybdopterin-dependent oxidoreductase [bacterium]